MDISSWAQRVNRFRSSVSALSASSAGLPLSLLQYSAWDHRTASDTLAKFFPVMPSLLSSKIERQASEIVCSEA
jgi:hypothetical protein